MSTLVSLIIVFCAVISYCSGQNYICDDDEKNKPVCECADDVCYFKLVIEHLQTFTAYEKEAPMGTRGRVFYIDSTNELVPASTRSSACDNRDDCTDPNTVDGNTYRSFISVNKQIPGPTLIVNQNATVVVDVVNSLVTEETSIHWHGIHQVNTPWMDGVGYITQCPIEAGTSFRYIFEATPSGTFWYHSHSGAQRTDGLFGVLIVKEAKIPDTLPPFEDNPGDHSLIVLDWARDSSLDLFVQIHSSLGFYDNLGLENIPKAGSIIYDPTCSADGAEVGPIPYWSGIVNGLGKHKDVKFSESRLSSFNVESGKTYRFRLIGAQANYAYMFSIDNHNLTVVATDGYFIEPTETDYIIIHTGERYDFLLTADQTQQTNFLIRFETLEVNCTTLVRDSTVLNNDAIAVLTYNNSIDYSTIEQEYANDNPKGCSESNICRVINCPFGDFKAGSGYMCINLTDLELLIPTPPSDLPDSANVGIDSTWFFNFGFDSNELTSTINGRNFILPSVSLQTEQDRLDMIESEVCKDVTNECEGRQCQCIHIIDIDDAYYKKTVRFVFSSLNTSSVGSFAHPVHLHGHSFHVVKIEHGDYAPNGSLITPTTDLECEAPCKRAPTWANGEPPEVLEITNRTLRKDTIIVPAGGYVVIDFIANSPGYWFLHCHIESHQLEGMALVINEVKSKQNRPPDGLTTCGSFSWTVEEFERLKPGPNSGSNKALAEVQTFVLLVAMLLSVSAVM